jgi:TfoX/Sxy family transcriptional regulator of competence genes
MAYDLNLAERIRAEMRGVPFVEKKMFGGVGFMLHGNLTCGVYKDDMILRIDPARHETILKKDHVKPFAISGKPMKGWLLVEADGCKTAKQIRAWVKAGVEFASTLPPK